MYAAGSSSPYRKPCQEFLKKLIKSGSAAQYFTSVEVLQEILHRYRSIGLADKAYNLLDNILHLGITVLPIEIEDIILARKLLEDFGNLPTRDGIHAAVVIRKNISVIASFDKDFDKISGIRRFEPS
jgi:predicted nucleic acid-binding protein